MVVVRLFTTETNFGIKIRGIRTGKSDRPHPFTMFSIRTWFLYCRIYIRVKVKLENLSEAQLSRTDGVFMLVDDSVNVHLVKDGLLAPSRLDTVHIHLLPIRGRQHQGFINRNRSAESEVSMISNHSNVNINIKLSNLLYPVVSVQAGMEVARHFMLVLVTSDVTVETTDQVVWGRAIVSFFHAIQWWKSICSPW